VEALMSVAANKDSLKYLDYIRGCYCLICFSEKPDPDHLEAIGMGGNRRKPTLKHYSAIPLCRLHHSERHSLGTKRFEDKYKINLWYECFRLLRDYFVNK
tara:strand:- start:12955 stop:13254 length:300 start_codon:yes stop_codon:yes gene_type:complete